MGRFVPGGRVLGDERYTGKVGTIFYTYRGFPGKVSKFGTTRDFPKW